LSTSLAERREKRLQSEGLSARGQKEKCGMTPACCPVNAAKKKGKTTGSVIQGGSVSDIRAQKSKRWGDRGEATVTIVRAQGHQERGGSRIGLFYLGGHRLSLSAGMRARKFSKGEAGERGIRVSEKRKTGRQLRGMSFKAHILVGLRNGESEGKSGPRVQPTSYNSAQERAWCTMTRMSKGTEGRGGYKLLKRKGREDAQSAPRYRKT